MRERADDQASGGWRRRGRRRQAGGGTVESTRDDDDPPPPPRHHTRCQSKFDSKQASSESAKASARRSAGPSGSRLHHVALASSSTRCVLLVAVGPLVPWLVVVPLVEASAEGEFTVALSREEKGRPTSASERDHDRMDDTHRHPEARALTSRLARCVWSATTSRSRKEKKQISDEGNRPRGESCCGHGREYEHGSSGYWCRI